MTENTEKTAGTSSEVIDALEQTLADLAEQVLGSVAQADAEGHMNHEHALSVVMLVVRTTDDPDTAKSTLTMHVPGKMDARMVITALHAVVDRFQSVMREAAMRHMASKPIYLSDLDAEGDEQDEDDGA